VITVKIEAQIPNDDTEELRALLQAVRSWDGNRAQVMTTMAVEAPNLPAFAMRMVFESLEPPFTGLKPTILPFPR